jgi:glycosyltransferase involved in cell wall biosynthesis
LDIKSWWRLFVLLHKLKPDVVLSNLFFSNLVSRCLGILLRYVSIPCEHNTYIYKTFWQRFADRILAIFSYKIIAVSQTVARFTSKQEGIPKAKFVVIHNGVDIEKSKKELASLSTKEELCVKFGFNSNTKILLNVARLTAQKNHQLLIDGFSNFSKIHPEYKLIIVGDGFLRDVLEKHVNKNKLQDKIIFTGVQKNVWPFYKMADAYVSTSKIEGLSMTYLEALSAGLPLIATSTAGTDEIITDGQNGFFILESTIKNVAEALEKLHVSNMHELSMTASKMSQEFDIRKMTEKYQDLIKMSL